MPTDLDQAVKDAQAIEDTKSRPAIVVGILPLAIVAATIIATVLIGFYFIDRASQDNAANEVATERDRRAASEREASLIGCERNVLDRLDDAIGWNAAYEARDAAFKRGGLQEDKQARDLYEKVRDSFASRVIICTRAFPVNSKPRNVLDKKRLRDNEVPLP